MQSKEMQIPPCLRDMLFRETCIVPVQPKEPIRCSGPGYNGVEVRCVGCPLCILRTQAAEFDC